MAASSSKSVAICSCNEDSRSERLAERSCALRSQIARQRRLIDRDSSGLGSSTPYRKRMLLASSCSSAVSCPLLREDELGTAGPPPFPGGGHAPRPHRALASRCGSRHRSVPRTRRCAAVFQGVHPKLLHALEEHGQDQDRGQQGGRSRDAPGAAPRCRATPPPLSPPLREAPVRWNPLEAAGR